MHRDILALALLLTACDSGLADDTGTTACTSMATASVTVNVSLPDGSPASGVTVTFNAGDGAQPCETYQAGSYVCGWEVAGDLEIHGVLDGYDSFDATVTVPQDECHVQGQVLDVTLSGVTCTTEVVPSVLATVVGSAGEELTGVVVTWGADEASVTNACSPHADDIWSCGEEQAGPMVVVASADGHQPRTELFDIAEDECHVLTEERTFALEWGKD